VDVILGARGQYEMHRPSVSHFDRRGNPVSCKGQLVDRGFGVSREVFDGAAEEPGADRPFNGDCYVGGLDAEAILEVG
jgi:hypothetical protein